MILDLEAKLISGALAALALLSAYAWWAHSERQIGAQQCEAKVAAAVEAANAHAQTIADSFEAWKAKQKPKTITITREVSRAIQADTLCSSQPLPEQLRNALTAAGKAEDQRIPDGTVPSSSAAGTSDMGGPGDGLR